MLRGPVFCKAVGLLIVLSAAGAWLANRSGTLGSVREAATTQAAYQAPDVSVARTDTPPLLRRDAGTEPTAAEERATETHVNARVRRAAATDLAKQRPPERTTREISTYVVNRTLIGTAQWSLASLSRTNVLQIHDCAAWVGGMRIDPAGAELLIRRSTITRVSTLRFCSIVATFATQIQFRMMDMPKNTQEAFPGAAIPEASLAILERPQHAMQFLFSLLGATAAQDSLGFDVAKDVAFVAIATYGKFTSWRDLTDYATYPHMELLKLLSKVGVAVISLRSVLPRVEMLAPPNGSAAWLVWNAPPASATPRDGPPSTSATPTSSAPPPLFPLVVSRVIFGGLPPRVLHYKKKQDLSRHPIQAHHFTNFRARIVDYFKLRIESDPRKRYAVVVTRTKQKRRLILNHDELVRVVTSVGVGLHPVVVVDWEGMRLRDQLQIALNANAIIGVHGNGHVWDCFMPTGSLMIEFSSDMPIRNEVGTGKNRRNVGNLAGVCPIESYSFRSRFVDNAFSKAAPPGHYWKEVDIVVSDLQLRHLREILAEYQGRWLQDAADNGFTSHVVPR